MGHEPDPVLCIPAHKDLQIVQFRRPDMRSHLSFFMFGPDGGFFRFCQRVQLCAAAYYDTIIGRNGCREIIGSIRMPVYIWIRTLRNPDFICYLLYCIHIVFSYFKSLRNGTKG